MTFSHIAASGLSGDGDAGPWFQGLKRVWLRAREGRGRHRANPDSLIGVVIAFERARYHAQARFELADIPAPAGERGAERRPAASVPLSLRTLAAFREGHVPPDEFAAVAGLDARPERMDVPDPDVERFLNEQFRMLLAMVARLLAPRGVTRLAITGGVGFVDGIDRLLWERVPISSKFLPELSQSLQADVARYLRRGGTYERAWGALALCDDDVTMFLRPRERIQVELGERATVLE